MKEILLVAETKGAQLEPVTLELAALARSMDGRAGDGVLLLVVGALPEAAAQQAAVATGLDVLAVTVPGDQWVAGPVHKQVATETSQRFRPRHILCPHSAQGVEYAPALAVRLGAACITAVNGVESDGQGGFLFSRPVCGGQFNVLVKAATNPAVIMVQPGLRRAANYSGPSGVIQRTTLTAEAGAIRITGVEKTGQASPQLNRASVIVAAGRGIGAMDNLAIIRRLVSLLPNAALAASRPLIDLGWLEYRHQVGITGATVAPPVYIACGISGSSQHIAGMHGAACVIAINADPRAAIFNHADFCIVDDVIGFVEAFESYLMDSQPTT